MSDASGGGELERRIRRLEDRAELHDLVVRYFYAVDDDDYDALAEVFSTEVEFAGGYGQDQVVELLREDRTEMGTTIHTPDSMLFAFEGDDAASGVILCHWELARGGTTLFGAARYVDAYVRERGEWRIRQRDVQIYHVGPWEEVGTSLTSATPVRWPGRAPGPAALPASS